MEQHLEYGRHDQMLDYHERDIQALKKATEQLIEQGVILQQIKEDIKKIDTKLDGHISAQKETNKMTIQRIEMLEKNPGTSALAYWKVVITALLTGSVGFIIAQLLGR